jgi:hypothetical protein
MTIEFLQNVSVFTGSGFTEGRVLANVVAAVILIFRVRLFVLHI